MYQTSNYNFHVPDTPSSIFQQLKLMADDIDAALQTVDGGGGTGGGGYINPTTGYIPVRSSATSFADSLISDTGASININGPVSITGGLTVNGQPIVPPTPHPVTSVFGRTGVIDSQLGDYPATKGGTGWGSYVIGDILFADSATTLARLADKATFFVLISGGIGVAPSWGKVNLNNAVTGLLPVTSGGTGTATVFTAGSVVFARAAGLYTENNANFFWDNTNLRLGLGVATPQARLDVNGDVLISTTTANLFLKNSSTGWLSDTSFIVKPQPGNSVWSTSYTSGLSGWAINALGDAEFNNVSIRGELRTSVFKVNEIAATAGTFGVFYSASTLTVDCTTASSFNFTAKNSDVTATARLFSNGDVIRMKAYIGPSGVIIGDVWATISGWTNNGPTTTYTVSLNSGSTGITFRAGTAVVDYGPSGTGFITLSTDGTVGSTPNMTMATHAGTPWSAFTPLTRVGNLNGSYGYSSTVYGFASGVYGLAGGGFTAVSWTPVNVVGGTFASGTFTKNTVQGWGNSGFSSSVGFAGDGYIEWTNGNVNDGWMIGLSYVDTNQDYVTINFAWHTSSGNCLVYENGGGAYSFGALVVGTTVLRIQRSGSTITYYKDGVAQRSVNCNAGTLYLDTAVYIASGQIRPVTMYSASPLGSWNILDTVNGLRIGSGTTTRIALLPNGSGFVANNNIRWDTAGNAFIAGWYVDSTRLSSSPKNIYLDSNLQFISTGYPTAPTEFLGSSGFWVGGRFGGLTAFWKLDGSADLIGGRVLQNSNVGYSAGKLGNCAGWNAAPAQWLFCPVDSGLDSKNGSFMACIWYQRTTISSLYQMLVSKKNAGGAGWDITMQSPNRICLQATSSTGQFASCVPPVDYNDSAWHFIFVWYDVTTSTINMQIDNGTIYTSVLSGPLPGDGPIYFGHPSYNLFGYLDAFAYGNFVPSATMRAGLWNGGLGTETVTYTAMHIGTVSGGSLFEGFQWNGTQVLISAAGGVTTIDSNGIRLKSSPAFTPASAYEIVDVNAPTVVLGALYDTTQYSTDHAFILQATAAAGRNTNLLLISDAPTGKNSYAQFGVSINALSVSYLSMNNTTGMQFWVGGKKRVDIDQGTSMNFYATNSVIWVPQDGTQYGILFANTTTQGGCGGLNQKRSADGLYSEIRLNSNAPSGGNMSHGIVYLQSADNAAQQSAAMFLTSELGSGSRMALFPTSGTLRGFTISNTVNTAATPPVGVMLDLQGVGALRISQLTTAQRNSFAAQTGMLVYNSTNNRLEFADVNKTWFPVPIASYGMAITSSLSYNPPNTIWSSFPFNSVLYGLECWKRNDGITVSYSGNYLIKIKIQVPNLTPNTGTLALNKNDVGYTSWTLPANAGVVIWETAFVMALNAGDFINLGYNNQNGAVTFRCGGDYPYFSASMVLY